MQIRPFVGMGKPLTFKSNTVATKQPPPPPPPEKSAGSSPLIAISLALGLIVAGIGSVMGIIVRNDQPNDTFTESVGDFKDKLEDIRSAQTGPKADYQALIALLDKPAPGWFSGPLHEMEHYDGSELIMEAFLKTDLSPAQKTHVIAKLASTQDLSSAEFTRLNDMVGSDTNFPKETVGKLRKFLGLAEAYQHLYRNNYSHKHPKPTMPAADIEAYHQLRSELANPGR